MEKECKECKIYFNDYSVVEKGMMKGCKINNPDICQECMSKGWTDDEKEVFDAINNDPGFKLGVKSPYHHKKF